MQNDAPLVIFFGGIVGGFGLTLFEFASFADSLDASKIFVRDLDQCWYQRGVRGLGSSIDETAEAVRVRIASLRPTRVVTVGNSAGGFAAGIFGALLDADASHAFSPQTLVGLPMLRLGDVRWPVEMIRTELSPDRRYRDLAKFASDRLTVHYSTAVRRDARHARRLEGKAKLRSHESGGHELVKTLRDKGELGQILRDDLT